MLCIYGKINNSAYICQGASLTIEMQVLTIGAQVLTIGMQVLTIRMQNAPAYIYELCVN